MHKCVILLHESFLTIVVNDFKELFLHFEAFLFLAEETFNSVEIEEQNDPI